MGEFENMTFFILGFIIGLLCMLIINDLCVLRTIKKEIDYFKKLRHRLKDDCK